MIGWGKTYCKLSVSSRFLAFCLFGPLPLVAPMYNRDTEKDYLQAALIAALGAGVVTSFAVAQGQPPLIALAITALAAGFAVLCHWCNLV